MVALLGLRPSTPSRTALQPRMALQPLSSTSPTQRRTTLPSTARRTRRRMRTCPTLAMRM
eukprot:5073584-Prorocentrum_lima.AAC.1